VVQANEVVVRTGSSGFRTEIAASGHTLVADEPRTLGGTDEGPTPYDYLAASLGACLAMTIRLFASRRGWPLEQVIVRLRHSRVHETDCEDCETHDVGIDQFEREVELSGSLTPEQRLGLLRIADRCPVGQTLARGVQIVSAPPRPPAEDSALAQHNP
jgi:putative redox protein